MNKIYDNILLYFVQLVEVRSSKDAMIKNLEDRVSNQAEDQKVLNEKFEEVSREFREINDHIVSCIQDTNQDTSLLEVLNLETQTAGEVRMRSTKIVSQLLENWTESERRFEKQCRDWESSEESYKLEMEKLQNEKVETCEAIEKEWQGKMADKEEEMEALVMKFDEKQKENDRIKVEMEKAKEIVENEKNDLVVEKDGILEQLNDAGLKLEENEQQLTALKEQVEKDSHDIEELSEEKQRLVSSNEEFESTIAQAKEEIDRLQLDIEVFQNERNHFEQSLISNTKRSDGQFLKLFEILGNEQEIENVEHAKAQLPEMLSDIVRQVRENSKVQENLREEKARVCNKIREEFESALIEKEGILEELRGKLKNTHSECDDVKRQNEDQRRQMKNLEEQVSALRREIETSKASDVVDISGDDRTHGVVEEDVIRPRVVEKVMTATSSDSLMAEDGVSDYDIQSTTNNTTLKNQLQSLTNDNAKLEEQLENFQVLYSERNLQIAALRGENETLKDLVSSLNTSELVETNERLQREIEQLQLANENLQNETDGNIEREKETGDLATRESESPEVNSLKERLQDSSTQVSQLKAELSGVNNDRTAYGKLRRDFDHIVSGLRGDLERVMSDRDNTAQMLDSLRAQVHERDVTGSNEDRSGHDKDKDRHYGDKDDGTRQGNEGRSLKEVEKELGSLKQHLHETSLVNRQLKQLGKSLDAELKETRKDKQQTEKKCQDLRDEMERFVKEKEIIIVESRERIETSERLHQDKLREVFRIHQEELCKATERSEYKELSSANEELQMKLNDAYEEINNVSQLEENNIALKREIDVLKNENEVLTSKVDELRSIVDETERQTEISKSENDVLTEKVEELKGLVDEADKQIELRDEKISELNKSIQENKENVGLESGKTPEAKTIDDVAKAYNDVILPDVESQIWREPEGRELIKAVNALELEEKPAGVIEYRPEMTSESEKLERELIQTSGHVTENQLKFLKEEVEREGRDRRIVTEQLEKERQERAAVFQELEKVKKISQKLKNMLKNSRSEVETLNKNLSQTKDEMVEKEQSMTTLRNEMSEIVLEKEEIVINLMSKIKDIEVQRDESLENLKSEYQENVDKRDVRIEKLSKDLSVAKERGDELKGQLDMWRQSYNEVSEKENILENEVEDLRHSLQGSIDELRQSKEISSSERSKARESIEELNEQLRTVIDDKASSDRTKNDAEASLALVREELEHTIAQRDITIASLHTEVKTAIEQLQHVSDELELQKSLYDDSLSQNEENQVKFINLQNEMNTSVSENDSIVQQLEEDLERANENLYNITQKLQDKTVEYQNLFTEKNSLEEQLKEAQDESQNTSIVKEGIIAETGRNLEMATSRAEGLTEQLNESLSVLGSERKRKEELDEISYTLRKDLELRTGQKRELEEVVMALNIDLEKALKDREELRQALRVKQTVTQATDNPCFDEIVVEEKMREITQVQQRLIDVEHELGSVIEQLAISKNRNESLEDELKAAEVSIQDSLSNAQNEKQRLEEVISGLKSDLQQSSLTKEEAINVLRMKLEEAVEERGGAVVSLKNEYDKMLGEKDHVIASLQDEIQRVNEEFTNLGYRFELTLQDNVSKGNNIMQLQSQVQEKQQILEENGALQERLKTMGERITELENEIHELNEDKIRRDFEKRELENSVNKVVELEKQLAANMKESEGSKAKQKKEFKRLYEGLQFDLENCRKQNVEKEKGLRNLREELEEIMKQKEALALKVRNPSKERSIERFQKSEDGDFVERFRDEKKELLQDLDKTRQEKDEIFAKFHNISEGLRRDLEAAINSRDEKSQECLKANVLIDKLQRSNAELEGEIKERDATISSLNSGLQAKNTQSSTAVEQLRAENQKLKSTLAQESMNAREAIVKIQNTNEELRQSLAKAEHDRENLRNYVASKEVQNEELKRQLRKETAERKRLAEEVRGGLVEIASSTAQEYDALNQTRTDLDEVRKS